MFVCSCVSNAFERTVQDRLHDCYVNDVFCSYHDGTLYLQGHTRSFYHKQMALEVARHMDGVAAVVNEIEVDS